MKTSRGERSGLYEGAIVLLMIALAGRFAVPVWDSDVWWHLATGRSIVSGNWFLGWDPFTLAGGVVDESRVFLLDGYWLSQTVFYWAYRLGAETGIIVVRVCTLCVTVFLTIRTSLRMGASMPMAILATGMTGAILDSFTGIRPQLFSFLFAVLMWDQIVQLDETAQRVGRLSVRQIMTPPLLMLVWANVHPGFILGTLLVVLLLVAVLWRMATTGMLPYRGNVVIVLVCAFTAVASLINPNGYLPYKAVIAYEGSVMQQRTSEYLSPVTLFGRGNHLPLYWVLVGMVVVMLLYRRRSNMFLHAAIVLVTLVMSLTAYRYIPFFALLAVPIVAAACSNVAKGAGGPQRMFDWGRAVFGSVLLCWIVVGWPTGVLAVLDHRIQERRFPIAGARYIAASGSPDNVFNHFNWGGYLIWRLYPEHKVFIDGRALNERIWHDYTVILWDMARAEELLRTYGINTIIMPERNPFTGEAYPLVRQLGKSPEWQLEYRDATATVFVRNRIKGPGGGLQR